MSLLLRRAGVSAVSALTRMSIRHNSARAKLRDILQADLQERKEAGTYKKERIITSPQLAEINVAGSDQPVLNFCANNYLGLSDNDQLVETAKGTLDSHGLGLSSVRFICGTQDIHKKLENTISTFHGKEDAILYASCFDANAGLFESILTPEDALFSDALNHASMIDGMRLCKAKKHVYPHHDLAALEEQLRAAEGARMRMIITDGVFSMDGDIVPLDKICMLADKYDALVMIDECHATGFLGKTGRGTPEYHGCEERVDIINSTLGKAMGGAMGGYTAGPKEVVDVLRQRSRPYLFSNTLMPAIVGASIDAFNMISNNTERRDRLEANTKMFREQMTKAGFTISGKDHPISPVMLGDARLASEFADEMLKKGIYVIGFSFPVVPKGQARIRVQLSAAHTPEQVQRAIDAFIEVGKAKGVI